MTTFKYAFTPIVAGVKIIGIGIAYGFGGLTSFGKFLHKTDNKTVRSIVDTPTSKLLHETYEPRTNNGEATVEWTSDSINKAVEEARELFSSNPGKGKNEKPTRKYIDY